MPIAAFVDMYLHIVLSSFKRRWYGRRYDIITNIYRRYRHIVYIACTPNCLRIRCTPKRICSINQCCLIQEKFGPIQGVVSITSALLLTTVTTTSQKCKVGGVLACLDILDRAGSVSLQVCVLLRTTYIGSIKPYYYYQSVISSSVALLCLHYPTFAKRQSYKHTIFHFYTTVPSTLYICFFTLLLLYIFTE